MARPSRWMQFAQNFNAMNSTLNDAFMKYDMKNAQKDEYLDDDGNALTGDALSRAKTEAMAGVYEKWGKAEEALGLRAKGAELEGLMRTNRIGSATEADQIYLQGEGARLTHGMGLKQAASAINANNASAAASNATTRLRGLEADAAQQARDDKAAVQGVLAEAASLEFNSDADEDAWVIGQLKALDVPTALKTEAVTALTEFGSAALTAESARLTAGFADAIRGGGVDGGLNYYNSEVADGYSIELRASEDGKSFQLVGFSGEGDNRQEQTIATATGPDAVAQMTNTVRTMATDPYNLLAASAQNLAVQQQRADLDQTETKTQALGVGMELDAARIEQIASAINVDTARIASLTADLGLTDAKTAAVVAETLGQNLENATFMERFEADVANIRSQMDARGLTSQLDAEQIALVAAQTTKIKTDLERSNPERDMGPNELQRLRDSQFAEILGKALAFDPNLSEEDADMMRRAFDAAMMPQGITHK